MLAWLCLQQSEVPNGLKFVESRHVRWRMHMCRCATLSERSSRTRTQERVVHDIVGGSRHNSGRMLLACTMRRGLVSEAPATQDTTPVERRDKTPIVYV